MFRGTLARSLRLRRRGTAAGALQGAAIKPQDAKVLCVDFQPEVLDARTTRWPAGRRDAHVRGASAPSATRCPREHPPAQMGALQSFA